MTEPQDSQENDPLRRLEERLDRASSAAERLVAEAADGAAAAARAARAARRPPDAGWQAPAEDADEPAGSRQGGELDALVAVLNSLRDLVPADLQRRLTDALREVLLALRALIDWYLERSEQRRNAPDEVQDIPIL